jgi:hypothetical protein
MASITQGTPTAPSLTTTNTTTVVFSCKCVNCNKYCVVTEEMFDDMHNHLCEDNHPIFSCNSIGKTCEEEELLRQALQANLQQGGSDIASLASSLLAHSMPFPNKVKDSEINSELYEELEQFLKRCEICGDWKDNDELDEDTATICEDGCLGQDHHDDASMIARIHECYEDNDYTKCTSCEEWTTSYTETDGDEKYCSNCAQHYGYFECAGCGHYTTSRRTYCDSCRGTDEDQGLRFVYVPVVWKRANVRVTNLHINKMCESSHNLITFLTPNNTFECDLCGNFVETGASMHGCDICNYDICINCGEN